MFRINEYGGKCSGNHCQSWVNPCEGKELMDMLFCHNCYKDAYKKVNDLFYATIKGDVFK